MAVRHSTRRRVGSSLSTPSTETQQQSAPAEDSFDDLFRRLLIAVSHIKLVSQHFGDLSGLSLEDSYAGMTLHEAANDLDQLYSEIDAWYVQHEHRPKTEESGHDSIKGQEATP